MGVCIITGASSGIGRETARQVILSGLYEKVVLIARNEDGLVETLRGACSNKKVDVVLRPFDLLNLNEIPELIENIVSEYGTISALINVSGYTEPASLFDTTLDNIQKNIFLKCFFGLSND